MYSLDECYQTYLNKQLPQGHKKVNKSGYQIIDQTKIVHMQKINYFQTKPSEICGFIFAKQPSKKKTKQFINHSNSEAERSSPIIDGMLLNNKLSLSGFRTAKIS